MAIEFLWKGIMIGIIFGMPVGAVGAMCIQRTMHHGALAGIISGSASTCADVLFACVGAFGLTVVSDFLLQFQVPIHVLGAILLLVIAFRMITRKDMIASEEVLSKKEYLKTFLSSFTVAITNPTVIISFLFAFSVFDINGTLQFMEGLQLVLGVLIGTLFWWIVLVSLVSFMKKKLTSIWLYRLNIVFAVILIIFSCSICVNTL